MNKGVRFVAAFTIIEMLVSISIFTIITSLVLANYPKFSEHFALERTAQEIVQSLREAKTLSLAVTESASGIGTFPGYGVHFDRKSKNYLIFADIYPSMSPNKQYEPYDEFRSTVTDRVDSSYHIQADAVVTGFCEGNDCNEPSAAYMTMDIVFTRPEPLITFWYRGSDSFHELFEQNVSIFITNGKGETKKVVVWKTGQISVKNVN